MARKQCPRCGQYLAKDQAIHWKCVGTRSWQLFRVPAGGAIVVLVLGMCALTNLPAFGSNTPALPTLMVLDSSANPTDTGPTDTDAASEAQTIANQTSTPESSGTQISSRPTSTPRTAALKPTESLSRTSVADAGTFTGTVNTSRLNARGGPGSEYEQIVTLGRGHEVILIGRTSDSSWVQVQTPDIAWVNANYIDTDGDIDTLAVTFIELGDWSEAGTPTGAQASITSTLRIRTGPGVGYKQLSNPDMLRRGATVDIIGKSDDGEWYKVNIDTRSAWISAAGVDITGDENAVIPIMEF